MAKPQSYSDFVASTTKLLVAIVTDCDMRRSDRATLQARMAISERCDAAYGTWSKGSRAECLVTFGQVLTPSSRRRLVTLVLNEQAPSVLTLDNAAYAQLVASIADAPPGSHLELRDTINEIRARTPERACEAEGTVAMQH